MKKINLISSLLFGLLLNVGCGASNSNSVPANTTAAYNANGSYCYSQTGQVVSCTTAATQYQMYNGVCYSSAGQVVVSSYCGTTASAGNVKQCIGYYVYTGNGYKELVQCNGADCRGYTLSEYSTGAQVICQ